MDQPRRILGSWIAVRRRPTVTATEVRQLLDHVQGDRYAAAWHLALSGLRRGEIAALRWSDVDFQPGTLAISRNRLRFGDQIVEGTVKSKASARNLPLPDTLADPQSREKPAGR
jgi:integrase